jgi:hypothetical protein
MKMNMIRKCDYLDLQLSKKQFKKYSGRKHEKKTTLSYLIRMIEYLSRFSIHVAPRIFEFNDQCKLVHVWKYIGCLKTIDHISMNYKSGSKYKETESLDQLDYPFLLSDVLLIAFKYFNEYKQWNQPLSLKCLSTKTIVDKSLKINGKYNPFNCKNCKLLPPKVIDKLNTIVNYNIGWDEEFENEHQDFNDLCEIIQFDREYTFSKYLIKNYFINTY